MLFDNPKQRRACCDPNSFDGPKNDQSMAKPALALSGAADRYDHRAGNDDYSQPRALFNLMTADQQGSLLDNIAEAMADVPEAIQRRQIGHFLKVHEGYGSGVAQRLGLDVAADAAE